MWELVKTNDPAGFSVVINHPRTLRIGRFGCDIQVLHPSISRNHATIEITKTKNGLTFLLKDHSSFGTHVNDVLITNGQHTLQVGDRITFGAYAQTEFTLKQSSLLVAVSSMDKMGKQNVKSMVNSLFGKMTNVCDTSCSFLVMPCLVVTAKVVCALLASIPIVTPAYLEEFLTASSNIPFSRPNPELFLPPLKEERLNPEDSSCFLPNEKRSSLFSKTIFYILRTNQFDALSPIIRLGNGEVVLCDSESAFLLHYKERFRTTINNTIQTQAALQHAFAQKGCCVIHTQHLTDESRVWQIQVYSTLRTVRRRPILESEIGFAVVYNSTDGYCNPEKRCPQKLYDEAGISQANSVNPFHLESQFDEHVLTEHQANPPASTTKYRATPKRPWSNSTDVIEKPPEAKRQRCVTRIIPPTIKNPPSRHVCLVPDSEAPLSSPKLSGLPTSIDMSSTHDSPRPLELSQSDNTKQKSQSGQPLVPAMLAVPTCDVMTTVNHVSQPSVDEDALSVLNSMPSLVMSTTVRSLRNDSHTASVPNTRQISRKQTTIVHDASPLASPNLIEKSCEGSPNGRLHRDTSTTTAGHVIEDGAEPNPPTMSCSTGWLAKRTAAVVLSAATQSSEVDLHSLPEVHPPIEYVDLVTRKPLHRPEAHERGKHANYKVFRKVWPLRSNRKRARSFAVQLMAFQPESDHNTEESTNEQNDDDLAAMDRERELVNRLFEQMCEMPRARL